MALTALTIPDRSKIRITTEPTTKVPCVMRAAKQNPGPIRASLSGGVSPAGNMVGIPANGTAAGALGVGYVGFNIRPDIPASGQDEALAVHVGVMVDGFAGGVRGQEVVIAATATPDPESTFSGLASTPDVATDAAGAKAVGVCVSATKVWFYPAAG